MVLTPVCNLFPSSAAVSCHFLFLAFLPSLHCTKQAAARGNDFVPPVPARGRGRRGSLTPSKGWDFIPNTHGWDEEA